MKHLVKKITVIMFLYNYVKKPQVAPALHCKVLVLC